MSVSRAVYGASIITILLALCALGAGCDDAEPASQLTIQIIGPDRQNAAGGIIDGQIAVRIKQGSEIRDVSGTIRDGVFDLVAPLTDVVSETELRVSITSPAGTLVGATPAFSPIHDARGLVRLVAAPLTSCTRLRGVELSTGRHGVGVCSTGTFVSVVGGIDRNTNPSQRAEFIDLLEMGATPYSPDLLEPLGRSVGVGLSRGLCLFVSDERAIRFDSTIADGSRDTQLSLHAGAGLESTLLSLGPQGAVVLGGRTVAGRSAEITWLSERGVPNASSQLATPRANAAAIPMNGGILVVGGNAAGAPGLEFVSFQANGSAIDLAGFPELSRIEMAASPDGLSALVIGGTGAMGAPRPGTLLVEGCPAACSFRAGPMLAVPRTEAAFHAGDAEAFYLGGRDAAGAPRRVVTRITWVGGSPRLTDDMQLESARAGSSATAMAAGVFLVVGGEGSTRLLEDVEICMPSALRPL